MKNLTTLAVAFLCITAINAQKKIKGNGNVVNIERNTGDYDALRVGGFYEVELIDGPEGKITLTGEDNILEYIETEVSGGTLTIKSENNINLNPSRGEKVFITVPVEKIDGMRLSGSGKVTSKKTLDANNFKVHTSGARNAELDLNAKSVTVISSGSSDVTLSGSALTMDITASGSSDINAFELNVEKIDIRSSGSSDIRVTANEALDTRVSGSGNVKYQGNPSKIRNKLSGSGKVSKE